MMSEYDWAELASVWTQPAVAHDGKEALRQALRRRVRMTALVVATELVLTAALLVWTLAQVRAGPDQASLAFGSILWVSWIVATGFAWWNRRGQWQRTVATTDEFIRISRVRADRKVRVAVFTGVLLVAQVSAIIALAGTGVLSAALVPGGAALFSAVVLGYGGWALWYYRRAVAERAHYDGLLRQLDHDLGSGGG